MGKECVLQKIASDVLGSTEIPRQTNNSNKRTCQRPNFWYCAKAWNKTQVLFQSSVCIIFYTLSAMILRISLYLKLYRGILFSLFSLESVFCTPVSLLKQTVCHSRHFKKQLTAALLNISAIMMTTTAII